MKQNLGKLILGVVSTASVLSFTQGAFAADVTDPNDPRSWQGATVGTFAELIYGSDTAINRQKVIDSHLLDDGTFNFTGATPAPLIQDTGIGSTGQSVGVGAGNYSYVQPGGTATSAGSAIDPFWVQTDNTVGHAIWDLLAPSTKAAVFPTIDHGPLPKEAIETTVYLSNDKVNWTQAVFEKVWLQGYIPDDPSQTGIQWDGFVYAVGTPGNTPFRYASLVWGGPGALQADGDDEINGVMGLDSNFRPSTNHVPEGGSTLVMLSTGLLALAGVARKRARA